MDSKLDHERRPLRHDPDYAPEEPEGGAAPRTPAKKAAILDGATRVFLEAGYERASMDAVAAAAGVSKATVYNHFGSKDNLFEAIIRDRCDQLFQPLRVLPAQADDPIDALTAVGRQYIALLLEPSSLALYRLLVAEATRNPEFGALSYRAGGRAAIDELAAYLARQHKKGIFTVADPDLAAEQFFGMLNGHLQARALLCVEPTPSRRRVDEIVAAAVRVFMRGYAPGA